MTRARCAAIRLEQLEHPRVGAARLAGQRVRDEVRQVEVADAHRVRRRRAPGRRPRPRSTARSRARPSAGVGLGEGQVHDRLEPRRARCDPPDQVGPASLDAERVIGVVGERGQGRRRRRRAGAATRVVRAPARRARGSSPSHARRAASPVTFCSRIAGTSDSRTAPRARDPDAREAAGELRRRADGRSGSAPASVVEAEQGRDAVESAVGARVPTPPPGARRRPGRAPRSRVRRECESRARRAPRRGGSSGRAGRATAARACVGGRAGRELGNVRVGIWNDAATFRTTR